MVTGEGFEPGAQALGEAKAFLRVVGEEEDALLERLVGAAGAQCEAFTGRVLLAREFSETLAASAAWRRLGRGPVRAITGVESLRADGLAAALPVSAFAIDINARGDGWVRVSDAGGATRVRVAYQAGLAEVWADLPDGLRQGIIRLVAQLYAHRDGESGGPPPAAVTALWRPWRRIGLRLR
ncbi:MAG TPA: phage head-tail connector protein [Allosphingosinicella sp.]